MKQEFYDELMQRIILGTIRGYRKGIRREKLFRKAEKKMKKILKMLDVETKL